MDGEAPDSMSLQLCVGKMVEIVLMEHVCLLESCATERLIAQMVVINL